MVADIDVLLLYNGNHFVLLVVDVAAESVCLWDSNNKNSGRWDRAISTKMLSDLLNVMLGRKIK